MKQGLDWSVRAKQPLAFAKEEAPFGLQLRCASVINERLAQAARKYQHSKANSRPRTDFCLDG